MRSYGGSLTNIFSMLWMRSSGREGKLVSMPTTYCSYTFMPAAAWSSADATAPPPPAVESSAAAAPNADAASASAPVVSRYPCPLCGSPSPSPPASSTSTPALIHTTARRRSVCLETPRTFDSSDEDHRASSRNAWMSAASIGPTDTETSTSRHMMSICTVPSVGRHFILRGAFRWWYRSPYVSSSAFMDSGNEKSGASSANGGQNSALTTVASSGDARNASVCARAVASVAAGVPGAGGALMLPFRRLESRMSFSITSHLCNDVSPNRSFRSSSACVSRSTSWPTLVSKRSASMFRYSAMNSSLLP